MGPGDQVAHPHPGRYRGTEARFPAPEGTSTVLEEGADILIHINRFREENLQNLQASHDSQNVPSLLPVELRSYHYQ